MSSSAMLCGSQVISFNALHELHVYGCTGLSVCLVCRCPTPPSFVQQRKLTPQLLVSLAVCGASVTRVQGSARGRLVGRLLVQRCFPLRPHRCYSREQMRLGYQISPLAVNTKHAVCLSANLCVNVGALFLQRAPARRSRSRDDGRCAYVVW